MKVIVLSSEEVQIRKSEVILDVSKDYKSFKSDSKDTVLTHIINNSTKVTIKGEPLHDNVVEETLYIVSEIRRINPVLPIWIYTGYKFPSVIMNADKKQSPNKYDILRKRVFENIDILITGDYKIDMKKTLDNLYEPYRSFNRKIGTPGIKLKYRHQGGRYNISETLNDIKSRIILSR